MPADRREGWRSARRILRGPLRTLVVGQALGQGADGMAQITFAQVVLFEPGKGAGPGLIAGVLAATLLPFSLVGPFAGVVIDRWDRRRVLVTTSLARVALAVFSIAVVVLESEPLAYVGIVLLLSSSRFVLAAKGAALPRTVAADELVTANAAASLAGMIAAFAGAVVGSTFVGTAPAAGFVVAGAAYALAAATFGRLPFVGGGRQRVELGTGLHRAWRELVEGGREIARNPGIRDPLLTVWAHRFLLGAGFILLVLIGDHRYHLETRGYGLALAVTGMAAFAGTALAPDLALRYRAEALLPLAFPVAGLAALLGGYAPELPILVAGVGVVALAFQVLKVLVDALVGRASDDRVRGRVFAAYDVVYNVAFIVAGLVLVPLWKVGRERTLLWGLAGAFAVTGLVVARSTRVWPFDSRERAARITRPPSRWRLRLATLIVGALPALAFPEPSWWWFAWFALVPMLLLVRAAPTGREGSLRAWWGATGFMITMHHWLLPNLGPFILPLAVALAALWLPWGRLVWELLARPMNARRLTTALVVLPAGWVIVESIRSWERLGGPWGLLGASQWNSRPTLAIAAVGGVWLVSLLIVSANVALTVALSSTTPRGVRLVSATAALLAVALGPSWYALRPDLRPGRTVRVAIVQPGVIHGPSKRFDAGAAISEQITRRLGDSRLDLVVWGESSFGYDLDRRPDLLARLEQIARDVGADLLVNVDARRGDLGGIYKTSVLVTPKGARGRYDKMRLVPFGEYVPLRFLFGWTNAITESAGEDRRRGAHLQVLDSRGLELGTLVCFESSFPDMSRNLANSGVDLIVVQSATSTFQESWAPEQHASLAAVRAVESGRPVVHATLTGESGVFDGRGRRLGHLSTDRHGSLIVTIPLSHETTPYDRLGEWIPALSFGIVVAAGIAVALARARRA